jgi:hypothetical protein
VAGDRTTTVLKEGDRLEVPGTNRLGDSIDASPVRVGKKLVLRSVKWPYCIESE